jgi:hypothetical protein
MSTMKAERSCRPRLRARGAAERRVHRHLANFAIQAILVPHLADQLALRVLKAGAAQVGAEAPVEVLQLVRLVSGGGNAAQKHEAAPALQLIEDPRQVARERRQREVVAAEARPGEVEALDAAERRIQLGGRRGGHASDPFRGPRHVGAQPRLGSGDWPCLHRAHRRSF